MHLYNQFVYNEFGYHEQYTGSRLQRVWLPRAVHWFPLTTSLVTTSSTLVPAYNEFGYYEQYTGSSLQRVRLLRAVHWFPLATSLVTMSSTLVPAYNKFGYYEQYTGSCLQRVQLLRAVHWFWLTTSSVTTSSTLVPTCNKFGYYEQYTGSCFCICCSLPSTNEVCKGYVFTRVCLSTGGGYQGRYTLLGRYTSRAGSPTGQVPLLQVHPPGRYTPWVGTPSACLDTVNKRAVRLPLECILISK